MSRFRVSAFAVALVVGVAAAPQAASADSDGRSAGNNVVSVENYGDDSSRVRSRAVITHAPNEVVANQNIASAYANCTDCRTISAAVQVLIVETTPSDFRPLNLAAAVNENCVRCETFAYARQIVLQPGSRVRLGDDAEDDLEDIDEEIEDVTRSSLPFPEMVAELDALAEELAQVVREEIERTGEIEDEDDRRDVDEDDD